MKSIFIILLLSISMNFLNCSFQSAIFNRIKKEKKGENIIISPLSIFQILSLTTNGAKGKTQSEMLEVLQNKDIEELNNINYEILSIFNKFTTVEIANAVMTIFDPLEDFKKTAENYLAPIEPLISVDQVNKWCKNKTHGKINKILDELSEDTAMILINAVYFKGEWASKFESYLTKNLSFYNFGTEEIKVETMSQIEHFRFYEDKRVKAIELRFKEDYMSAIIILPSEDTDINKYIDTLSISKDEYFKIINGFTWAKVHLQLPKFELEYEQNLNEILTDLGMYDAFSAENADFTGLRKESGLFINRVIHKTYLKVFEDGCEAAGVTVIDVTNGALPGGQEKIYDMKVNRPFLFLLKNSRLPEDYNLLFMSKIETLE